MVSAAALDRTLAVLVVALVATGLLGLRAGDPGGEWIFLAHRLLAGGLAVAVGLKLVRSLPPALRRGRWLRLAGSLVLAGVTLGALAGGYLWATASGVDWVGVPLVGAWTFLTLHAWAGLLLVPLVVVHLLPRRWRLLRPPARGLAGPPARGLAGIRPGGISRRAALGGVVLLAGALALTGGAALVERIRGGSRRFTGSRWLPAGGLPPPTTFFGEPVPPVDEASWRVAVEGAVERPARYGLADLRALGEVDLTAVLDCTSGWAIETAWRGIPLGRLLDAASPRPGAGSVTVRSVTGWSTVLPLAEARRCLLATGVAGGPLPLANGAPLRLVAPERRGLDWVKWIARIEVA